MKIHKIPCDSEFRAYALTNETQSHSLTHETQSRRESCVFSFNHVILYFPLIFFLLRLEFGA